MVARKNCGKLHTLLSIPLRGQQICWLDSGEGDEFVPLWRDGKV